MYKTLRKVLLLFLISIAVVCGSLFAVACGDDDKDDDKGDEGAKVTYSVTVTVTPDAGVALTSLKAQWYSGDDPASDPIALSSTGLASVDLDAGNYVVDLVGVPDTATYTKASVTATAPTATINVTKKPSGNPDGNPDGDPVLPTKLSTPTDLDISDGVLTWTGDDNASSYDVYLAITAVAAGSVVASDLTVTSYTIPIDLESGDYYYSVVAKGDGADYSNSDRSVSKHYNVPEVLGDTLDTPVGVKRSGREISWTGVEHALSYNVYFSTDEYDDGKLIAKVKDTSYTIPEDLDLGVYYYSIVAQGDGVEWGYSEKSNLVRYAVLPAVDGSAVLPGGAGTEHWYPTGDGWKHSSGAPYTIDALGNYYIPVKFQVGAYDTVTWADVIKFTAPEDGEHTYVFSWDVNDFYAISYKNGDYDIIYNSQDISVEDRCLDDSSEYGSIVFSLLKGEEVTIILQYQDRTWALANGDDVKYSFTITAGDPIAKGSIYDPFEIYDIEGTHSVPEGYDKSEAYFALPFSMESATYEVTFGSGLTVYVLQNGRNSNPVEILSGGIFAVEEYVNGPYIYVTTSSGADIEFTLEKVALPGSADDPIVLEKDVETSYTFVSYTSAWFTFTPAASGFYNVSFSTYVTIYKSVIDGYGEDMVCDLDSNRSVVYLEGGVKYYLSLGPDYENPEVSILVTDAEAGDEGTVTNPAELTEGSKSLTLPEDSGAVYLVYHASATGALSIVTDNVSVYVSVYSDINYSQNVDQYFVNNNYDVPYFDVVAGDTLYIRVYTYESINSVNLTVSFLASLDAPVASVSGNTISWTSVDGATGYAIYLYYDYGYASGSYAIVSDIDVGENTYDLSTLIGQEFFSGESYTIWVVALGDYENKANANSNKVTYTVDD